MRTRESLSRTKSKARGELCTIYVCFALKAGSLTQLEMGELFRTEEEEEKKESCVVRTGD